MKNIKLFSLLIFNLAILFSCSNGDKPKEEMSAVDSTLPKNLNPETIIMNSDSISTVDLNQDLSNKSLQELRLLRNSLYARHGFCFMQADLRAFFSANAPWYDSLMEARFWAEEEAEGNGKPLPPIKLTPEEDVFVKKIQEMEKQKSQQNYITIKDRRLANIDNIINLFQYKDLPSEFLVKLKENNFVIVPSDNIQLFHVYEKNDYHQLPNFVTSDLYLQLFHMYFSYVLKSLEKQKFIPIAIELTDALYSESMKVAASASDEKLKSVAEYNAAFYAIPNFLLTGKAKNIPSKYKAMVDEEIKKIGEGDDLESEFLDFKNVVFPYSLFKPRGHYTRSEDLQRYFRAMMWLQMAPYCREKDEQLTQAAFIASIMSSKSINGKPLSEIYNSIYEPIAFIIGEPDNLSVMDIVNFLKKNNMTDPLSATKSSSIEKINKELIAVAKNRNRIKPKVEVSCPDKINFMPQRYLMDNEIMQELVDIKADAKRAYPKGLDVFAALGNESAEDILQDVYHENENWSKYNSNLKGLKKKFEKYAEWDKSVYNKWIQSLVSLLKKEKNYPLFMQTKEWDKKNLNTALASWAELKHDAILYGEQPSGAECGGGGPPPPITVGYVEPNVNFWKQMIELLKLTEDVLKRNDVMTSDIGSKATQLKENAVFLLTVSEKELSGLKLTEQEYNTIEFLGGSIEYLSLSIIDPDYVPESWEMVQGPDKSVAVIADVYTRNIPDCSKNGILHEAVGNVNELYVVVEIEGNLYLTKGAIFSYYEFVQPPGERLTDEEWQKMIEDKKLPPIPEWMEDILVPSNKKPVIDEKAFYSSGC